MNVSDYDAVSLYPSAMSRMDGFLKGKPKILSIDQLNKAFLDKRSGYFIHVKVINVGVKRAFPLLTRIKEDGVREFSNDTCENQQRKRALRALFLLVFFGGAIAPLYRLLCKPVARPHMNKFAMPVFPSLQQPQMGIIYKDASPKKRTMCTQPTYATLFKNQVAHKS